MAHSIGLSHCPSYRAVGHWDNGSKVGTFSGTIASPASLKALISKASERDKLWDNDGTARIAQCPKVGSGAGHQNERVPFAAMNCPDRNALLVSHRLSHSLADGVAGLWARTPPKLVAPDRWQMFIRDAESIASGEEPWVVRLERLGWSQYEVWGGDPQTFDVRLDRCGLVAMLKNWTLEAASSETAVLRSPMGSRQSLNRNLESGAVLIWELES